MAAAKMIHRIPVVRLLAVRPRLMIAMLAAASAYAVLPDGWRIVTRLLAAWDCGLALYLVLAAHMMLGADNGTLRRRAAAEDEGSLVLLGLMVFGAAASLAAIMRELANAKSLPGHAEGQAVALAAVTVILSWFFMQTMFAVHYAHEYYRPDARQDGGPGLEFPAQFHAPDYWDFVYFAFVIGTAAATADINLTSRRMRRIVTLHCIVVFFFNTSILALAINIGAGLVA